MPDCAVLVVEDDESIQALLHSILKKSCTTVDRADDGERAVEMLGRRKYDIVVLDLMLPKVNGFKVSEAIESLSPPKPKLIVISALARYFEARFPPGAVMLQKPFQIDQFENAVRDIQSALTR